VSAAEEPRAAAPGEYLPDLLTERPPTDPGRPGGAPDGRDPAHNWGVTYSEPLPSVEGSPHWDEIGGAA
jgi:hypothetical protein